jgi:hypothetical protein
MLTKKPSDSAGRKGRRAGPLAMASLAAALAGVTPVWAQGKLCARQLGVAAWPVTGVVAPGVAAGSCAAAPAWSSVMPLSFTPSGLQVSSLPAATVSFAYVPGGKKLFIGLAVDGDTDFSDQDIVYLVFDHNNDGVWDDDDFYLQIKVGPATPIVTPGGLDCNRPTTVTYFQHRNTGWESVVDPNVAAQVTSKAAYDYDLADPDHDLWNLELVIPIGAMVGGLTFYDLQTAGAFFAVGAYAFVDKGHQQVGQLGMVLRWPSSMQDRDIAQQDLGFDYSFSASSLKPTAVAPGELADAEIATGCFDVNFDVATPWVINNSPAASGDHRLNRGAANTVRANFRFDGPGNTPGSLSSPNTGTIEVSLTPYIAGGHGPEWIKSQPVSLTEFNTETGFNFQFDFGSPPGSWPAANNISFICAWLRLKNFLRNDNTFNDEKNINYNYFVTSDYTHDVEIVGDRLPYLKRGQLGKVLLSFVTSDRDTVQIASGPSVKDRWQVTNARELGLRPLKGERGWYLLPIRQGETKRLRLRVNGLPLKYRTEQRRLAPGDPDGRPNRIEIPARPGQVVTVLAFGEIDLDGTGPLPPTSPEGVGMLIPVGGDAAVTPRDEREYLLRSRRYAPQTYAGAVIGSFDGFRTGFPIGRNASLVVPEGSHGLSLAINAALDSYRRVTGQYDIYWIVQPAPQVPTFAPMSAETPIEQPRFIEPWRILTSLNLYSFYETEDRVGPRRVVARTRHAYGSVHYSVYQSHQN